MENDEILMIVQMKATSFARNFRQVIGEKNEYYITTAQLNDLLINILHEAHEREVESKDGNPLE